MTCTPTYRGIIKDLKKEIPHAKQWIVDQIIRIMDEDKALFGDEKRTWILKHSKIWLSGEYAIGFGIDVAAAKDGGYFYNHKPFDEREGKFIFRMGRSTAGYTGQRIVLRKNGTINDKILKEAMYALAYDEIAYAKKVDVYEHNKTFYESLGKPCENHRSCYIELSQFKEGECRVKYDTTRIKFDLANVKIRDIESTVAKIKSHIEAFSC